MRGSLGGARVAGLLLVVIAVCISIPMNAPLLALGLAIVPGAQWHLFPMALPFASSFGDRAGSCLHDGRFQSLAQLISHPPTPTQSSSQSAHAGWVFRVFQ